MASARAPSPSPIPPAPRESPRSPTPDLYFEEAGEGVPFLLIPPSGATASTWGSVIEELAGIGRVIAYDRRGYARSGGGPVRSVSTHTADAAALLEHLGAPRAVVVGTSAGAAIAVHLAVRRPDLVRAVVAHEFPWRFSWRLPNAAQIATMARIGWSVLRGRPGDAADVLLRYAYSYREGGTAWDAFPAEWRQAGRENGTSTLWDFVTTIGNHPTRAELGTIRVPVVCSYGARSPDWMSRLTWALAAAIPTASVRRVEGAAHAAPFDAPTNFVHLIADAIPVTEVIRPPQQSDLKLMCPGAEGPPAQSRPSPHTITGWPPQDGSSSIRM